ncbi:APC family permease [Hymenobacter sp. BRD67]|uniref:APC family permease n=1 Tax=Hymenobacter sp. BRD67 TaxID=2675877 RepID=UPI0020B81050|nr:amino acid permease [Hymenobacter sp. BRD67]
MPKVCGPRWRLRWQPGHRGTVLAVSVVLALALVHGRSTRAGSRLQVAITAVKVLVLVGFIGAGLFLGNAQPISFAPDSASWRSLLSPVFAVSLVYVSYAYSGWNAAVYVTGEIKNPQRNLSRILLTGTAVVLLLYVGLNYVFLRATPLGVLKGQVEVGYLAASWLFGPVLGRLTGALSPPCSCLPLAP